MVDSAGGMRTFEHRRGTAAAELAERRRASGVRLRVEKRPIAGGREKVPSITALTKSG